MKEFIEDVLHQNVELNNWNQQDNLPLFFKGNYDFYSMGIDGQHFLLMKPKGDIGLSLLRKQQKRLEQLTGLYCVLYLTKMNYYSRDKMLEEGIPFIWENRQIYMPFWGILLNQNEARELKPCTKIAFLTQKLLLTALYDEWKNVTVSIAADYLNVSKMSITRCFDEIECLELPVLEKKGRTRIFSCTGSKKKMWKTMQPVLRNPLIQEYFLKENLSGDLVKSGFSALSEFSMLEDNIYPTCALTKGQLKDYNIKGRKTIPKEDTPGCIVQELGYLIPFKSGKTIDPLTILLLLEKEKADPRVDMALEKMLEDYVW